MRTVDPPRIVALLLLLVLVDESVVLPMAIGPLLGTITGPDLLLVVWSWLLLLIGAALGLAARRPWAVVVLIVLVIVSTIAMGIALVPFIMRLVPEQIQTVALLVTNGGVLLTAPYLHASMTARGDR